MRQRLLTLLLLGVLAVLNIRAAEVYTHFDPETGVLMYYYDDLRTSRGGTNELYNPNSYRFGTYYQDVKKAVIHSSMKNAPLTSTRYMFNGSTNGGSGRALVNLKSIEGLENLNTTNVTDMYGMFYYCAALETLDLSSFNVSKVTDMRMMFAYCFNLETIYCNTDWSTSSVLTQSTWMFRDCNELVGGKGTTYYYLKDESNSADKTYARLDGGTSKPGYFTQPIDKSKEVYTHFNSSTGVLTYYYDSQRASRSGITEDYAPELGRALVHFQSYYNQITKAVVDPSMKDAPLTSMRYMFNDGNGKLLGHLTAIEGLENLNTAIVRDMERMFYGCYALTSLDLSSFNTSNVTRMDLMFYQCTSLVSLDVSMFKIERVRYMAGMFSLCKGLKTIYCDDDWSTSTESLSTAGMFSGCTALVGGKGTKYDSSVADETYARPDGGTSKPGYFTSSSDKPEVYTHFEPETGVLMYYYDNLRTKRGGTNELYDPDANRFKACYNLVTKAVVHSSMKQAPLTSTAGMFWGGTDQELINLTSIEGLENLNMSNVTNMNSMFNRCARLETLDLSSFDVSKVTIANYMFRGCESLTTIYCDTDWSTSTVMTQSYGMFQDCTSLVGGQGTVFDSSVHYSLQDKRYARPDGGTSKPGYFTSTTSSGILPTVNDNLNVNDSYYTLDGRKLQGKPTQTGVYIQNGIKVVVR